KAIVEPYRKLPDPAEAAGVRDCQKLEIEGVALDEQMRNHGVHERASKELDSDLGVSNVEVEQNANQLLIEPGVHAPPQRIVDLRVWMPLRADGGIKRVTLHRFEKSGKLGRRQDEGRIGEARVLTPP